MHLAVAADDGVRMAAMQIKRVDFNWATAGSNLYLVSECGPGLQQCPPVYRGSSRSFQRRSSKWCPGHRQRWSWPINPLRSNLHAATVVPSYACGRRKSLSPRDPLQLRRLVQFDRRLTPFNPCYAAAGGAGAPLYSRMIRRRDLN
jgi:hypothetical protein